MIFTTCSCGRIDVATSSEMVLAMWQEHAAGRLGHHYGAVSVLSNPSTNFAQVRAVCRAEAEERRALMFVETCMAEV